MSLHKSSGRATHAQGCSRLPVWLCRAWSARIAQGARKGKSPLAQHPSMTHVVASARHESKSSSSTNMVAQQRPPVCCSRRMLPQLQAVAARKSGRRHKNCSQSLDCSQMLGNACTGSGSFWVEVSRDNAEDSGLYLTNLGALVISPVWFVFCAGIYFSMTCCDLLGNSCTGRA